MNLPNLKWALNCAHFNLGLMCSFRGGASAFPAPSDDALCSQRSAISSVNKLLSLAEIRAKTVNIRSKL